MPEFNFNTFLRDKDRLAWRKMKTWQPGIGAIRHLVWLGFVVDNGRVSGIPSYFAFISVDDENGMIGVSLAINTRFEAKFNVRGGGGQKVVDNFVVGRQEDVSDQVLIDVMRQRYGLTELDFKQTPMSSKVGTNGWKANAKTSENILARKVLYNKADQMIALVLVYKIHYTRGPDRYQVCALAVPIAQGIANSVGNIKRKPSMLDVKDVMADWSRTIRELRSIGFGEEVVVPDWATSENWDFDLGVSMEASMKVRDAYSKVVEEYSSDNIPLPYEDDDFSQIFEASTSGFEKKAQANASVSQYYQGPIPDSSQLDQYVGTPNVEASQIRGIFGGVDEAISLVNQFDSSLLTDVAFIYNFSGGGAYGVYMSALDEQIKNSKLKSMLRMDGYQIQDMPNGAFYATHKDKDEQAIDSEIKAYRQQIDQRGASTFGIDMNKVVGAAKSDANEAGIIDQADQRLLGVLHLGATMVHEAVHSKGSHSEGPSEQSESRFMAWAMPIINEQRRKAYESQNRTQEYTPLVVDQSRRRMASSSNWLERAASDGIIKEAQYGAQFLQNQTFVKHFGPAPWSSAYWSYGVGPIESMLDRARPQPSKTPHLSFEGHLRQQNKDKWMSSVDTGSIAEELLESGRDSLVAYKSTETLMEDGREKPLMLPVPTMRRKANSYDSGKEAFGYMSNLDLPMEDRVQKFDENDEETTWFDQKFVRNQTRYRPEYGNPMSKEDGIYSWFVDPSLAVTKWEDAMNERPSLRTSPWQRAAACGDDGSDGSDGSDGVRMLSMIFESAIRGITRGKIRGTRFVCQESFVPLIRKFFENDLDVRVETFSENGSARVWVVSDSIPRKAIELAEAYVTGELDDESGRRSFEYVTNMPTVRSEAMSRMIEKLREAMRDAEVKKMLVLGDLPLAVRTGQDWSVVRTVDFCCKDPDACVKLGEIVCSSLGATVDQPDRTGTMVARWRGVTFRFMGDCSCEALAESLSNAGIEPTLANCELYGRLATPLMLALDVMTEEIVDPSGEADPDVEAKVVRTFLSPDVAVALNPLVIIDAIFLASEFGFSIDSGLANAAASAEFSDPDAKSVWAAIRAAGKGKSLAVAEEYGMEEALSRLMGEKQCQCQ